MPLVGAFFPCEQVAPSGDHGASEQLTAAWEAPEEDRLRGTTGWGGGGSGRAVLVTSPWSCANIQLKYKHTIRSKQLRLLLLPLFHTVDWKHGAEVHGPPRVVVYERVGEGSLAAVHRNGCNLTIVSGLLDGRSVEGDVGRCTWSRYTHTPTL